MKKWLFPCNLGKYDILGSFLKNGFVDYGTNLNVTEGDEVFIYTGAPYSAIFLKCRVRAILTNSIRLIWLIILYYKTKDLRDLVFK